LLIAAIGLCAGGGMCLESIAAILIGVATLTIMRRFEDNDDRVHRRIVLTLSEAASPPTDDRQARRARAVTHAGRRKHRERGGGAPAHDPDPTAAPGGKAQLVAALQAEPGVARLRLDPLA
jgi:putative Mg2+ transporter-C (MgtC) family protein